MDMSSDCRGRFNIGCRDQKEMEIESSCITNELTGSGNYQFVLPTTLNIFVSACS